MYANPHTFLFWNLIFLENFKSKDKNISNKFYKFLILKFKIFENLDLSNFNNCQKIKKIKTFKF